MEDAFFEQTEQLSQKFRQLSSRLSQAAEELTSGNSPYGLVAEQLQAIQELFLSLKQHAAFVATKFNFQVPVEEVQDLPSLSKVYLEIQHSFNKISAQNEFKSRSLFTLQKVNLLASRDPSDQSWLDVLKKTSEQLRSELETAESVSNDLEVRLHPFQALMNYLEEGDPSKDRLEQLLDSLDLLDRKLARNLNIAIIQGNLFLAPSTSDSVTNLEEANTESTHTTPNQRDEETIHLTPSFDFHSDQPNSETEIPREHEQTPAPTVWDLVAATHESTLNVDSSDQELLNQEISDDESDPHQIAKIILNKQEAVSVRDLERLIWSLISTDRLGLAYHISRYAESLSREETNPELSRIIRSVLLGRHVLYDTGEIMAQIKSDFEYFLERQEEMNLGQNHAQALLLIAASLRPAILAPNTNAFHVLNSLRVNGFTELYELCQKIARFGQGYHALSIGAIKWIRNKARWEEEFFTLQKTVENALYQFPNLTMPYQQATSIWRKWMENGGFIHDVLQIIRSNNTARFSELESWVRKYSNPVEITRMVQHTDRKVLGRHAGADITATALDKLHKHVRDVLVMARKWIELQDMKPDGKNEYFRKRAEDLFTQLRERTPRVFNELEKHPASDTAVSAGLVILKRSLEELNDLFDPDQPVSRQEENPDSVLNLELLPISDVLLTEDWEPLEKNPSNLAKKIINHLVAEKISWNEVFEARLLAKDSQGTQLVLDYLEKNPPLNNEIDLDDLRLRHEKSVKDNRESLIAKIRDVRKQVERAFTNSLLGESERSQLMEKTHKVEQESAETLSFVIKFKELQEIEEQIRQKHALMVENHLRQFTEIGVTEKHPDYSRIRKVLDEGDFYTANEYHNILSNNQSLPVEEDIPDPFKTFVDCSGNLEKFLKERNVTKFIQDIKNRRSIGPVSMKPVGGKQAEQAANMMDAWFTLKRTGKINEEHLKTVLNAWGLTVLEAKEISKNHQHSCWEIKTEVIADRELCPLAAYGSAAKGRYRIHAFWERETEEDLIKDIGETFQGPPVIVLYFARMTAKKRRDLAKLCRERRRTFLLVDDLVMAYLCGERGSRLPVLFKCTLPFTYVEPYTTTAGNVPPEIFYGRNEELESIMRGDAGFVYGGRQLGKTVLLREAKRRFHNPGEGHFAIWIDLKVEGIGLTRPADDIWSVIASELDKHQILKIKGNQINADKLLRHIEAWLAENERRRLLLLLDEADLFLEIDGKEYQKEEMDSMVSRRRIGFARCSKLKGLMDRTNRRFHVVFAGLHNVQRSVKNENDPLAHYGKAICVGPLLSERERREARNLIKNPFAAMGYQFEDEDLVSRILSQTNYYPSLIQLYCKELLSHMLSQRVLDSYAKYGPPYVITAKHLDEVYQNHRLQEAIKHNFMLTLRLDPRFEVIAYTIAYELLNNKEAIVSGLPAGLIREKVMDWWEKGFKDCPADSFRILLDEMKDLGVLRTTGEGNYTLRSSNLMSLIGSEEEIWEVLLSERDVYTGYEPAYFRRAYYKNSLEEVWLRCPLTAEQESRLLKQPVSVIFGSPATGIHNVEKFLSTIVNEKQFYKVTEIHVHGFANQLSQIIKQSVEGQPGDVHSVVLVDSASCPWTPEWVEAASGILEKSRKNNIHCLFLSDPGQTWMLVNMDDHPVDKFDQQGILFTLSTWKDVTLKQWVSDCGIVLADSKALIQTTHCWPNLLYRLYDESKNNPHQFANNVQNMEKQLTEQVFVQKILLEMGIDWPKCDRRMKQVLNLLTMQEKVERTELEEVTSGEIDKSTLSRILKWGELLSLVSYRGRESWAIDPLVGRLIGVMEASGK